MSKYKSELDRCIIRAQVLMERANKRKNLSRALRLHWRAKCLLLQAQKIKEGAN